MAEFHLKFDLLNVKKYYQSKANYNLRRLYLQKRHPETGPSRNVDLTVFRIYWNRNILGKTRLKTSFRPKPRDDLHFLILTTNENRLNVTYNLQVLTSHLKVTYFFFFASCLHCIILLYQVQTCSAKV